MRSCVAFLCSLFVLCLVAAPSAFAQTPGACETGTAQALLDESGVQASLFNTGGLFYGGSITSGNGYLVTEETRPSLLFAAAVWIGGKVDGEIRASHARFGRWQMWPGPLDDGATLPDPDDCSAYDRFWTVTLLDVLSYEDGRAASADLASWPVGLGAPTVDASGQPVAITSRDQTIDLAAGERPVVSGTQMVFWVMNDVGNTHVGFQAGDDGSTRVEESPLGVEVAVTASAIVSEDDAFHQGTFYRYTITNRNTRPITEALLGFWVDPDLGDAADDYIGVDTTRGMGFVYNSGEDADYGPAPPAVGFDLLGGLGTAPLSPKSFPTPPANTAETAYNQLLGLWPDGTPVTMQGNGYETDGPATVYGYPGDPVAEAFWSEVNTDGDGTDSPPGDRRLVVAAPAFELQPGDSQAFELAILYGRGEDHLDSITQLRAASDRVQAAYEDGTLFAPRSEPLLATPEAVAPAGDARVLRDGELFFEWTEVPDAERYRVELSRSPDFADAWVSTFESGSRGRVTVPADLVGLQPRPLYWRVRSETRTRRSLYSPTQSFLYYRFVPGTLTLASGAPAIVEVVGPDGTDPCASDGPAPPGCDEVGGRLVFGVPNSTGAFAVGDVYASDYRSLSERAKRPESSFEIRFSGSSYAYSRTDRIDLRTGVAETVRRLHTVPFQLWDLGPTLPTGANDPSDDERLIPVLSDVGEGSLGDDVCGFAYAARGELDFQGGFVERVRATKQIAGVYPSSSYAAFAEYARRRLAVSSEGCAPATQNVEAFFDTAPFDDLYFVDTTPGETGTTADLAGAVVRLYTRAPFVENAPEPQLDDSAVGAPYPNPASGLVQIPYRLGATADVELAVFDVLGRKVVQLREGRQPRGDLQVSFDARGVAPGIYIVRLQAGDVTRSARLTVVR